MSRNRRHSSHRSGESPHLLSNSVGSRRSCCDFSRKHVLQRICTDLRSTVREGRDQQQETGMLGRASPLHHKQSATRFRIVSMRMATTCALFIAIVALRPDWKQQRLELGAEAHLAEYIMCVASTASVNCTMSGC